MSSVKILDLKPLREDGYLQEVNRMFFHPLGLALAVRIDDDKKATMLILDARDDPEGYIFSEDEGDLSEKAARIKQLADARREAREKSLGFWIQPAGPELGGLYEYVAKT
jgi:endonuclease YncB( thermonuclease family)